MKIATALRTLVAACAFGLTTQAAAAPILLVDGNGILTGAQNVNVAGKLYNVVFQDGSCISLYDNCNPSAFTFNTYETAGEAMQALLGHVFVDGPQGQFGSQPYKTRGCTDPNLCRAITPYARMAGWETTPPLQSSFYLRSAYNDRADNTRFRSGDGQAGIGHDTTDRIWFDMPYQTNATFAVFTLATPAADVPEPASIALFGLAMAGLAFNRRRKG